MMMMKRIAALLILVPASGCALAQEVKKEEGPERWEKNIAAFEANEAKDPPPKNAILFVGSSSVRMWKLDESYPDRVTINRGFGGSTMADSVFYFDRVIAKHEPKAVLIYAGDNDVNKGLDAEGVFTDYKKLAALMKQKLPDTPLIYIAIKPSLKRWELWPIMKDANDRIAAFCKEHDGFYFADIGKPMLETADGEPDPSLFKDDGLHLNDGGYTAWKGVIDPILKKALATK